MATYRGGEATRIEQASDYLEMYTRFTGVELGGLTVGVVGFGAVGREVAARLAGFGTRVLAYDPYVPEAPPGIAWAISTRCCATPTSSPCTPRSRRRPTDCSPPSAWRS